MSHCLACTARSWPYHSQASIAVHIYLVDRHFEELCLCAVRNNDEVHNVVKQVIHTE